jgi:hypothetical protein
MLETTLATEFVPGTNVRWQVTGANWTFLLPSLEIDRALCIGLPTAAALATLARISCAVDIVCLDARQKDAVDALRHGSLSASVNTIRADDIAALPVAPGSVDLVVVADAAIAARLGRDPGARLALDRLLTAAGRMYWEASAWLPARGPFGWSNGHAADPAVKRASGSTSAHRFWLTPLAGEMHTAVPLADGAAIDFFLENKLYSLSTASLKRQAAERVRQLLRGGGRPKRDRDPRSRDQDKGRKPVPVDPGHSPSPTAGSEAARGAAVGLARLAERTEQWLVRRRLLMRRQGMLAARDAAVAGNAPGGQCPPPAYLTAIACSAGVDIAGMRWGLSARGAYSSRKVLVFLFEADSPEPSLIVKMTRDGAFNARLDNEARGLAWLEARGVGDAETLPRAVFHGHHGGLAIVGESVIAGVPFRERARWAPDCPYAAAAIDWLVDLSAKTVDREGRSDEAAETLAELFRRFDAIYTLAPDHRAFLEEQIAAVGAHPGSFGTVFQHGDPGTWNLVATPGGRVAFLDWEAAETRGMPLWDLFYFLRSYGVGTARAGGTGDALQGFREQFVDDSPLAAWAATAVARGREAAGIPAELVEPLFHTCWMHRALKESTRLSPDKLDMAHYLNLLRLGIDRRDSPGLARIFGG